MTWKRIGQIFDPTGKADRFVSHATTSVVEVLRVDLIRVYFSRRDSTNRAQIGFFEINIYNPFKVLRTSQEPVIAIVNLLFLQTICSILLRHTPSTQSSDYQIHGGKNDRLVVLGKQAGARHYISGPTAKDYLDESIFAREREIAVSFINYFGFPKYSQLFSSFERGGSIFDLIFNMGPENPQYMKSF